MPVITITDYTTVYPTPQGSVSVALSSPAMVHSTTTGASSAVVSTVSRSMTRSNLSTPSHSLSSVSSSTATSTLSTSVLASSSLSSTKLSSTSLPSGSSTPAPHPDLGSDHKAWDNRLAILAIMAIVLCAALLLALVAYALYTRVKGKCPSCRSNEDKMQKWASGELKPITKAMVKAREQRPAHVADAKAAGSSSKGSDLDVARGEMTDYQRERQLAHEEALAALNGVDTASLKPSLLHRAKVAFRGIVKGRGKGKAPRPSSLQAPQPPAPDRPITQATAGDRFFTVDDLDPAHDSHGPDAIPMRTFRYETSPAAPKHVPVSPSSKYSRATDSNIGRASIKNPGRTSVQDFGRAQQEHYNPDPLPSLPSPTTYSEYMNDIYGPREEERLRQQGPLRDDGVPSVISSTLNVTNPRHVARYEAAQRKMEQASITDMELQAAMDDVNVVEAQMRRKRRSQAYGGLPHPDTFGNGGAK